MIKPPGHYIVKKLDNLMVAWYAEGSFYIAGSTVPYNKNHFEAISEEPLDLGEPPTVKGTKWKHSSQS